jgi:predicted kinase
VEKSPVSQRFKDSLRLLESLGPLPRPVDRPVFVALSGLPGTGKSYFSKILAEKLPVVILESDALRKRLFTQPSYSWQESARLFRACYFLIEDLLDNGISLILDATNLNERYRRKLYNIAEKADARFILVKTVAPQSLVKERLEAWTQDPLNQSDAGWEVYQAMKPRVDKIRRRHYVVNTSRDITPVLNKILLEAKKQKE